LRSLTCTILGIAASLALAAPASASASSVFYIRGGGDGHGVGMSQYGAYGYALHGAGYRAILAHYYQGTTLGSADPARVVRVLLKSGSAAFSGAGNAGSTALNPGTTYSVQAPSAGSLVLVDPSGKRVATFAAPLTVSGPGPLTVVGLGRYRGSLEFRPAAGGIETVNALALDDYVRGVVSAEMPSSWSVQALDAQAVAARTFALTNHVGGSAFDVYSDTRSQAYRGVAAETRATNAAVAATSGQIVSYGGRPAITYFFSSSGGYTENVENVFGGSPQPWLRGVPDPYDGAGGDPYHHWGRRMSVSSAAGRLSGLVKGSLVGIKVTRHGVSPRIVSASVVGSKGQTRVSGTSLQTRFGLLSTWASFTTITTNAGAVARTARTASSGSLDVTRITAHTAAAVSDYVHQVLSSGVPIVYGKVFPGTRGSLLLVQRLAGRRWQTVRRAHLGSGGAYRVRVPGAGSYRVMFGGLAGPTVRAG
jgi:stage II sporulation protein D